MEKFKSPEVIVNRTAEELFKMIGDLNNLEELMPSTIQNFESTESTCSVKMQGFPVLNLKLAEKINSSSQRPKTECLIEINTSGESQKKGFKPKLSKELITCFSLENLGIVGLMTIGPYTTSEKEIRGAFQMLRVFKDQINQELGENKLTELSMGMSNDFELGIEEGSTMVRVGTGIFGPRNY